MGQSVSLGTQQLRWDRRPAIRAVLNAYPYVVDLRFMPERDAYQFHALFVPDGPDGPRWGATHEVDTARLAVRSLNEESMWESIADLLNRFLQEFTYSLPEGITGKYPFTRLYHDFRLTSFKKLFGFPAQDIPGWVWPKMKIQKFYPVDKNTSINQIPIDFESGDTGTNVMPRPPQPAVPSPIQLFTDEKIENQKGLERAMSDTKKKKIVTRVKAPIDPAKVKKPRCMDHDTPMEFDRITEKWRCTAPNCTVVARPKRSGDDRDVIVGKGEVALRLIQAGKDITVILMSDDNVALDITKFVDVEKLILEADVATVAQSASESGRESVVLAVPSNVPLKMRASLIGISDFLLYHS